MNKADTSEMILIESSKILLNKDNCYKYGISSNNPKILGMAESIKRHGIIQPIIVKEIKNKTYQYEIIEGNKRFYSSQLGDNPLKEINCIILNTKDMKEQDFLTYQITLNEQRYSDEDFHPIEQCYAYLGLMDKLGIDRNNPKALADYLGLEATKVNRIILLDKLDDRIKKSTFIDRFIIDEETNEPIQTLKLTLKFLTRIRLAQETEGVDKAISMYNEGLLKGAPIDPRYIEHNYEEESKEDYWEEYKHFKQQRRKTDPHLNINLKIHRGISPPLLEKESKKRQVKLEIGWDVSKEELHQICLDIKNYVHHNFGEDIENELTKDNKLDLAS